MILAQLFRLDHPDGVLRMSTLPQDWTDPEGAVWIGGALVLEAGGRGPTNSDDGGAFSITWNGATAALLAAAQDPGILRAHFETSYVYIDDNGQRAGSPFRRWVGLAEVPEAELDPARPRITVTAQSPLIDFSRATTVYLDAESQRRIDPTDTGGDWVATLREDTLDVG